MRVKLAADQLVGRKHRLQRFDHRMAFERQLGKLGRGIGRLIDSYAEAVISKAEFEPRIAHGPMTPRTWLEHSPILTWLIVALVCGVCVLLLARKVRAYEVVK